MMGWSVYVSSFLLCAAFLLSLFRLLKGPTFADRVAAFDLLTSIIAGAIAVYMVVSGETYYFFVLLVWMFVAFLGTSALALYIKEKGGNE